MITLIGCKDAQCLNCTKFYDTCAPAGSTFILTKIKDEVDDHFYCSSIVRAYLNSKHKEVRFGYCDGKTNDINLSVIKRLNTGECNENTIGDQHQRKPNSFRKSMVNFTRDIPASYLVS